MRMNDYDRDILLEQQEKMLRYMRQRLDEGVDQWHKNQERQALGASLLLAACPSPHKPKWVHVASRNKRERRTVWKRIRMRKAIYATGWDGHVVIEAATNGWKRRAAK